MSFDFNSLYQFWFLIISTCLSILCCLFTLYHLLFNRNLRQALNNHVITVLIILCLIMECTDIPFILNFYRFGMDWQITKSFSLFWTFVDYTCSALQLLLFAWATIERHILIFHDRWLATKRQQFFFHYLPLILILTYTFIYYLTVVIILSCDDFIVQNTVFGTPVPCLYFTAFLPMWDLLCHQIIPTITIVIFSLALLVRILYQKSRMRQGMQWRKQRKMTIQLLSITLLYLLLNFPWSFILFCQILGLPINIDGQVLAVLCYLPYYLVELFPFVCCVTVSELRKKLKKIFFCQRQQQRIIHPATMSMNNLQANQTLRKSVNNTCQK